MDIKNKIIELLIAASALILLFYSSDPVFYDDSVRYLNQSVLDPPLYSSIILIMQSLFNNLNSVVIFQTLFIAFAIIIFTRTLVFFFKIDIFSRALISLFLFLPILKFYQNILTEPLSYALSILFVSFVIRLVYKFNIQNLIWSSVIILSLLLTRNQFIFLYPVIFLLYIGILFLKIKKKKINLLIASFISILVIHNSIIFLNTYIKQDSLKTESLTYVNLGPFYYTYIDAIYISDMEDVELFENHNIKKTLNLIFKEMNNREALMEYYNSRGHFALSLREINYASEYLLKNLALEENTNVISLKKEISITLIKANFEKYIKLIFKKFYDSTWLFVFLPFLMMVASLINFIKYKSHISLIMLFLSLFTISNHSVIYLFGRVQPRYLIYTDFILLIFIYIIFNIFLQNKGNKRKSL